VHKHLYFLLLIATLCGAVEVAGAANLQDSISFVTREKQKITVTLVFPKSFRDLRSVLREKVHQSLVLCEERMGISLIEDFSIYFDQHVDLHNGLSTVLPTNRINVHSEAPEIEDSIGLSTDYLSETIIHEISHMTVMQRRAGVFSFFDHFVGNSSRPLGLWPRWMHEGLAVWTEAVKGGRPSSGYIDFDLRRYADHYSKNKIHPISNQQLDGSRSVQKISSGAYPYHFGYLFVKDIFGDDDKSAEMIANFIKTSSSSLGMSFRIVFRENFGINLDERFEQVREKWAQTPLSPSLKVFGDDAAEDTKRHQTAPQIVGPWLSKVSQQQRVITWIESSVSDDALVLKSKVEGQSDIKELKWVRSFAQPLQAYWLSSDLWIVLSREHEERGKFAFDTSKPLNRRVLLMQGKKVLCYLPVPGRIRELHVSEGILSWIRGDLAANYYLEKAQYKGGCDFSSEPELVVKSEQAFQRISSLYIDAQHTIYSLSNPSADHITENLFWNGERVLAEVPLAFATPIDANNLVATMLTPEHWGPVLIEKNSQGVAEIKSYLPVRTGAYRTVPLFAKRLYWIKESFWSEDRITEISEESFISPQGENLFKKKSKLVKQTARLEESQGENRLQGYSAWPSVWPHFWVPQIIAVTGGFAVIGQTFYQDLSQKWSGSSVLGYDSFVQKPFFTTSLSRSRLGFWPINALGMNAYYYSQSLPLHGRIFVQSQYGANLRFTHSALLNGFGFSEALSIGFLKSKEATGVFREYNEMIVSLSMKLSSDRAQNPENVNFRLSSVKHAFSLSAVAKQIKRPELTATFLWQIPFWRSGIMLSSEYGWTHRQNFPISYFNVGGLPDLATSNTGFLTRGFSYRLVPAKEAVRVATEWGLGLGSLGASLGWNRLSLSTAQLRLIAESVSFTTFGGERFRVGRQYFSTLGSELDLIGSSIFYIRYRISVGAYRGFGEFGETRFGLVLRSGLDI